MSTCDNGSYFCLLRAIRERNHYDTVFQSALDELSGKVDFSWVKSCVALGSGCGSHEIPFVKRFMPNLHTLVAVDEDHESVKAIRTSFQELPGVDSTALEVAVQQWKGVEQSVDAVLLFDVLMHVERAHRQALFQQLMTRCLVPNGIVIVITECDHPSAGFMRLLDRLGKPAEVYYDEVEAEMLTAGFSLAYTYDIRGTNDFSNPSEDLVKYFQLITDNKASQQEVRSVIADIFKPGYQSTYHKKFAVFKKSTN